jgi:hypothetical protein
LNYFIYGYYLTKKGTFRIQLRTIGHGSNRPGPQVPEEEGGIVWKLVINLGRTFHPICVPLANSISFLSGSNLFKMVSQAFWTAKPFTSLPTLAAVALAFGTLSVAVSNIFIMEIGMPRQREAICQWATLRKLIVENIKNFRLGA